MDYLKTLCEDLNLTAELEQTEEGCFLLPLPGFQLAAKALDPGVLLTTSICSCPKAKREELLILLMRANLFGQGTLGATLGLDPDQDLLLLSWAMPYDMQYQQFRDSVEDFANVVDYWRDEIDAHIRRAQEGIL